ncbi:MAG: class I SAM-dependent methyltransferase [Polyangiales bacterium]
MRIPSLLAFALIACSSGKPAVAPQPPPASPVAKVEVTPEISAAVSATDRDPEDVKLDAGRKPAETLAFFGVLKGAKVGELFVGRGYTTELLARVVGDTGVVYAENNKFLLERFAEAPWSERLKKPVMKPVIRVDRELESPFPPEAKDLDAVIFILAYHDTVWQGTDRAKMNTAVFNALKKGGVYGIVDHSGRVGTAATETQTLHRIEETVVRKEVEAAGFKLAAEADFLRNPQDPRDWNASPMKAGEKRGTSDRFVLKFVKP